MRFNFLAVIALLLSQPLTGFSQKKDDVIIVWYENQTRYCLTEGQALSVVELDRENEVHKGLVIDLTGKVKELEEKSSAKDTIINATEGIAIVERERVKLTKKELRQQKNKAIRDWFKNNGQKLVIGAGAFIGGVAVGIGTGMVAR